MYFDDLTCLINYGLKVGGAFKEIPYLIGSSLLSPILILTFYMSWSDLFPQNRTDLN
jgi:hypothetical protein